MEPAERTPNATPELSEQGVERTPAKILADINAIVGLPSEPIPPNLTQPEMEKRALELYDELQRTSDFSRIQRYREYRRRVDALQHQAQFDKQQPVDKREFSLLNDGVTYHQYLPLIVRHQQALLKRYQVERATMPDAVLPANLKVEEDLLWQYAGKLEATLRTAVHFVDATTALGKEATAESRMRFDTIKKTLDPASQRVLESGDREAFKEHINKLDQEILNIIADQGHRPGMMTLNLLIAKFDQLADQERDAARDPQFERQKAEHDALKSRQEDFKVGKPGAEPLNADQIDRLNELRRLMEGYEKPQLARKMERRAVTDQILSLTESLGDYQVVAAELSTIRSQFKSEASTDNASPAKTDPSPLKLKEEVEKAMLKRSNFYRGNMSRYLNRFDEEALKVTFSMEVEDFSNKQGREIVRDLSNRLSGVVTFMFPDGMVRDKVRQQLDGPLNDAMGWPMDKRDMTFGELAKADPKAAQEVMKRMQSVKDAIQGFNKQKIRNAQETLSLFGLMPAPEKFVGEEVKEPLPEDRVTRDNMQQLITDHGAPTVWMMLFRQMDSDWGGTEPRSGFMGELSAYMGKLNDNMDTHIDVAEAMFKQGDGWFWLMVGIVAVPASVYALYKIHRYRVNAAMRAEGAANKARISTLEAESAAKGNRIGELETAETANANRIKELEKKIADIERANKGPSVAARKASANAKVKEYLSTEVGREAYGEIGRNVVRIEQAQGAMTKLQALQALDDAAYAKELAAMIDGLDPSIAKALSGARGSHLSALRRVLDDTIAAEHALRVTAARQLLGVRFELLPTQRAAIWEAHTAGSLIAKEQVLLKVFSQEQTTLLLRSGICGDVGTVLARNSSVARPIAAVGEGAGRSASAFEQVSAGNLRVAASRGGESIAGRALTQTEKQLVARWSASEAFGRMLFFAGAAAEAYIVYEDILALQRAEEFYAESTKRMKGELDALTTGTKPILTKKGDVYWYGDKVSIDAKALDPTAEKNAANWRLSVDSASLTALLAAGLGFSGPPGWLVLGAVVTVHTAVSAWEKNEYYNFVRACPPWLLARFNGTTATINQREEDLITDSFADLPLGVTSALSLTETKDLELRKKLFFSLFIREMSVNSPRIYGEIVGAYGGSPDGLQRFYENDFQKVVLPFYKTQLFVGNYRADVPLSFLDDLDTERGANPLSGLVKSDIGQDDMANALREAGRMYVTHLQEKQFLEATALLEAEKNPVIREMLEARLYELGSKTVLGTRLLDAAPSLVGNKGRTRAELLMERFRSALSSAKKDATWEDIMDSERSGKKSPYAFRETPMNVDGRTDTLASYRFSTNRDFSVPMNGIGGMDRVGKDGMLSFSSSAMRSPDTRETPSVDGVVPALEPLYGADAYPMLKEDRATLMERRSSVVAQHREVSFLETYLSLRAQKEASNGDGVAAARFDRFMESADADLRARYDAMPLGQVYEAFRGKLAFFLQDLRQCESDTRGSIQAEQRLRERTTEAAAAAQGRWSRDEFRGDEREPRFEAMLRNEGGRAPIVMTSGLSTPDDVRAFDQLLEFPLKAGRYLSSERLYAVQCQKVEKPDRTVQYVASFVYSSNPIAVGDKPEAAPQDAKPYVVQIGAVRREGSGYLEIGIPVITGTPDQRLLAAIVERRAESAAKADTDILKAMDSSERMFRAGQRPGVLTQIDRDTWGVRLGKGKDTSFVLVRKDPATGAWQAKSVELPQTERSNDALEFKRWAQAAERVRTSTGRVGGETPLLDEEKSFATDLEAEMSSKEWENAPADLLKKFNLDASSPSEFQDVAPLPADVLDAMESPRPELVPDIASVEAAIDLRMQKYLGALRDAHPDLGPRSYQRIAAAVAARVDAQRSSFGSVKNAQGVDNVIRTAIFDAQKQLPKSVAPFDLYEPFSYLH